MGNFGKGQSKEHGALHLRKPRVLTPLRSLRKERSGVSTLGLRRWEHCRFIIDNYLSVFNLTLEQWFRYCIKSSVLSSDGHFVQQSGSGSFLCLI